MKNEERILELLAETLQRIDQHSERFDLLHQELKVQQDINLALLKKIQQHDDRLDRHEEGIGAIRERTELMQQSALEQQKAYREMTELLLFHNTALRQKGIL